MPSVLTIFDFELFVILSLDSVILSVKGIGSGSNSGIEDLDEKIFLSLKVPSS